jgi:hypothetical protein
MTKKTTRRRMTAATILGAAALSIAASSAFATGHPATGFGPVAQRTVVNTGETFYKATASNIAFNTGETMTWSGNADGTGTILVDDVVQIQVKHQDGTKGKLTIDYSHGCTGLFAAPPRDISALFAPGLNTVTVTYKDKCGGGESATSAFIS